MALDVGHTLSQPGAVSARGVTEFEYNRRLEQAVQERLVQARVPTIVVGGSGAPLELRQRTWLAGQAGASLFLSLHHDSVQSQFFSSWTYGNKALRYSDIFTGFSIFVSKDNPNFRGSLRFAKLLGDEMLKAGRKPSTYHALPIPGEGRPLLDPARGIYRYDQLMVLRMAQMPAVLLESAFIVNRAEEEDVRSAQTLATLATAISRAILHACQPAQW